MKLRATIAWSFPVTGLILMFLYGRDWQPWQRLLASTLGLLYLLKITTLLQSPKGFRSFSAAGLLLFMSVWPGMDASAFLLRQGRDKTAYRLLSKGISRMVLGFVFIFLLAFNIHHLSTAMIGWLGIGTLLLTIHLGYSDVLTALLRLNGWRVHRLFDSPLNSNSLRDFWGKRWNLAFVEMDHILFFQPLKNKLGVTTALVITFIISGLLHEMGISYPVWSGWGLPLLYFVLQAVFIILESKLFKNPSSILSRITVFVCIVLPLPLLFHEPFRNRLIVPLFQSLNVMLTS